MKLLSKPAPIHIYAWMEKIGFTLEDFLVRRSSMSGDEQIDFVRRQYRLLRLVIGGIEGRVQFTGAYHGLRSHAIAGQQTGVTDGTGTDPEATQHAPG
jgi:hypothetical protein